MRKKEAGFSLKTMIHDHVSVEYQKYTGVYLFRTGNLKISKVNRRVLLRHDHVFQIFEGKL